MTGAIFVLKNPFRWLRSSWEDLNLRQKLSVAFVSMTLFPLLLGTGITEWETAKVMKQFVFERNRNLAEAIALDLDQMISENVRVLKMISGTGQIALLPQPTQTEILQKWVQNYQELHLAVLTDSSGRQKARSDGMSFAEELNYSDQTYFQAMLRSRNTAVSNVLTAKSAGWLGVVVAEPVFDAAGEIQGALIGKISLASIQRIIHEGMGTQPGTAFVINQAGRIIIHSDRDIADYRQGYSCPDSLLEAFWADKGWVEYKATGKQILAGFSTISTTGWKMVVEQPLEIAMTEVTNVQKLNVFVILIAVLLAILTSLSIAHALAGAVCKISLASDRVAEGDFKTRLDLERKDEIGQLAENFNRMTAQLSIRTDALKCSEEKFHSIVDNINIGVYQSTASEEGMLLQINPAMVEIFGYPSIEELLRTPVKKLYNNPTDRLLFLQRLERDSVVKNQEAIMRKFNGTPIWCSRSAAIRKDSTGSELWMDGVIEDITERKLADEELRQAKDDLEVQVAERTRELTLLNEELYRMSLSDGLTGINNRRSLDEYLEREWNRAKRDQTSIAGIMIDIDYFKLYNDTYGHIAGDECLKKVACTLKTVVKRPADFVARYGGEEFAILLPGIDQAGVMIVGEKIRRSVEAMGIEHRPSSLGGKVTVSVGVAVLVPTAAMKQEKLLELADQALYRAKQAGRNQVAMSEEQEQKN